MLRRRLPSSVLAHKNCWIRVDSSSKNNMGMFITGKDDLGNTWTVHEDWIEDYKYERNNMNRWLTFKLLSSLILLGMTTVFTMVYDTSVNNDLWLCVWALCLVRFVDALDDIDEKNNK